MTDKVVNINKCFYQAYNLLNNEYFDKLYSY